MDEELTEKLSNEAVENDEIFQRLRRTLQGMIENAESALVQKVSVSARVLAECAQEEEESEGMSSFVMEIQSAICSSYLFRNCKTISHSTFMDTKH